VHEVVDAGLVLDGAVDDVEPVARGEGDGEGGPVAALPQLSIEVAMVSSGVLGVLKQPARVALSAGVEVPVPEQPLAK